MGGNSSKGNASRGGLKVILLGLDASGKTSILYGLKMGEQVVTIPTIGPNIENIMVESTDLQFWDVGGQERLRPLWKQYYTNIKAVIYVLDATDRNRLNLVYGEFAKILNEQTLQNVPILIFANKKDLPGALTPTEITTYLRLNEIKGRKWTVMQSCAVSQDGLQEGVDWIRKAIETP